MQKAACASSNKKTRGISQQALFWSYGTGNVLCKGSNPNHKIYFVQQASLHECDFNNLSLDKLSQLTNGNVVNAALSSFGYCVHKANNIQWRVGFAHSSSSSIEHPIHSSFSNCGCAFLSGLSSAAKVFNWMWVMTSAFQFKNTDLFVVYATSHGLLLFPQLLAFK